jgi:hypothetical protein
MNTQNQKPKTNLAQRCTRHIKQSVNEVLTARHPKDERPQTLAILRNRWKKDEADRMERAADGTKKKSKEADGDRPLTEPDSEPKPKRRRLGFAEFCMVVDRFEAAKKAEDEARRPTERPQKGPSGRKRISGVLPSDYGDYLQYRLDGQHQEEACEIA